MAIEQVGAPGATELQAVSVDAIVSACGRRGVGIEEGNATVVFRPRTLLTADERHVVVAGAAALAVVQTNRILRVRGPVAGLCALSSGVAGDWEVQSFGSTIGPTSLPGSALCVTPHGTVTSAWVCPGSGWVCVCPCG